MVTLIVLGAPPITCNPISNTGSIYLSGQLEIKMVIALIILTNTLNNMNCPYVILIIVFLFFFCLRFHASVIGHNKVFLVCMGDHIDT